MKLFAIFIKSNVTAYGGTQPLRQAVLFLLLAYDELGRISRYYTESGYTTVQDKTYIYGTYTNNGVTYATNQLVRIEDNTYNGEDSTATYNANGYITGISYNGNTYTYEYDALGRLTAEKVNGVLVESYTYDNKNNIQKTGLTYTNGKLTSVNGKSIEYDALGNPTTYKGNTFVWEQGRKLASGSINQTTFKYNYDGNGMRYEKMLNANKPSEIKVKYYYNGDQLLMESRNGNRIFYIYGVTGIEGMVYKNDSSYAYYYYDKNTLGDIIGIRDESGNIVATYEYDAWGNITYSSGSMAEINPFRYRGYYYDTETGFYYLQTRYYDPTICRFINADNYELVAELSSVAGQLNMYAYCGNNPVMYTDETGCFWSAIGDWFSENWVKLAVGAGFIVAGAAITFFTAGMGTVGLVAAGSALLASAKAVGISMAVNAGIGAIIGGITGGWEGALQGFGGGLADGFMLGGIFAGSAQILGGVSKLFASRNVNFSNKINVLFGNRNSQSTTLLRVNQAGKQLFRIDADISHLWHLHYGQTSAAMRIHRTGIALYSYLGIANFFKGIFGEF